MKFTSRQAMIATAAAVFIIAAYAVIRMKKSKSPAAVSGNAKFIVYGTEWCGYTTKQRKHLDDKYGAGSHEFVDCDKGNCPGVEAFPVTKTPSGEMVKGFNTEI